MTTRHTRWERTGAEEHAAAYEEARAALLLGQMVHDRRTELAMTQADLAERAGMTQPQLSRLESGGATPTVPLLVRLAAALDADLDIAFRPRSSAAACRKDERLVSAFAMTRRFVCGAGDGNRTRTVSLGS
jgi:transcriptional regulator with XRE-family HTH domain